MPTGTRTTKSKVTVTLSPELVRQLDLVLVDVQEIGSRSQLVEQALLTWLREHAKKELERQTEEYYRSLTEAERKEDRQWSKAAARSVKHFWDK